MTTAQAAPRPPSTTGRLTSIDTLRGIVMILMALDHVRDFFGVPGLSPTNLAQTTVPLFFTRWITHFCAPTFFLLTGTGAFLALRTQDHGGALAVPADAGLWLILLELTVIRCLGFQFNVDYQVTMLIVIWALGWAMIALAALVLAAAAGDSRLRRGHDRRAQPARRRALDASALGDAARAGLRGEPSGFVVFVAYPLIPWMGVTAVGYGLGQIYDLETSAPSCVPAALRPCPDGGVRGASGHQSVRRPGAVGARRRWR